MSHPGERDTCADAVESDGQRGHAFGHIIEQAKPIPGSQTNIDEFIRLLDEFDDIFRIGLRNDPPMIVPPWSITLTPDATSIRCRQPRYPPLHRRFLEQHIQKLVALGKLRLNPQSLWASKALVRAKPNGRGFRQVSDLRRVHMATVPIAWPANDMAASACRLVGSSVFSICDADGAFFQYPLAPDSQEILSIMTDTGVCTPTVLVQGQIDATAIFQFGMQDVFGDLVRASLEINIDDTLAHSASVSAHMQLLRKMLERARHKNLVLSRLECKPFLREAKWCGKIYSAQGVRHDPQRISARITMGNPVTAGNLQQYVCALGWMRNHIPRYSTLIAPLQILLHRLLAKTTKRNRAQASNILIKHAWKTEHADSCEESKRVLADMIALAHLRPGWDVH